MCQTWGCTAQATALGCLLMLVYHQHIFLNSSSLLAVSKLILVCLAAGQTV
jgi:hypothetical protein